MALKSSEKSLTMIRLRCSSCLKFLISDAHRLEGIRSLGDALFGCAGDFAINPQKTNNVFVKVSEETIIGVENAREPLRTGQGPRELTSP